MKSYETKLRINDNRFMRINSLLQNEFGEIPSAGKFTDGYLYRSGLSSIGS